MIQNHAWHRFQAFARRHLQSLCCSILIWADTLFSDRLSTQICCCAQDSIQNMLLCSYVICLLRDQWMIARLSEALGAALVSNNLLLFPSKISFHMKKKWLVAALHLQSILTFSTVDLSQYSNSGSMFSSSEPVTASTTAADLETPCVCALPSDPPNCAGALPQELGHWFCSQILRLSSLIVFRSDCQITGTGRQGLELGLKLELCRLINGL